MAKRNLNTDRLRTKAAQLNELADTMDFFKTIGAKQYMKLLIDANPKLAPDADRIRRMMYGRITERDKALIARVSTAVKILRQRHSTPVDAEK